jgi:hypothetical protein
LQKWATEYGRPEDKAEPGGDPSDRKESTESPRQTEPSAVPGDQNQ